MFSLIVYGNGEMWSVPEPWSIDATRFLEYSCEEAQELFANRQNLLGLEQLPTIVTGEWGGSQPQIARFGLVRDVTTVGRQIRVSFDEHSHTTDEFVGQELEQAMRCDLSELGTTLPDVCV